MASIHPDSFRALAYETLNQLNGGKATDDSTPTIYQIEAELKHQYGLLLEKDDQQRLKLGQSPDPSRLSPPRLVTLTKPICHDTFMRTANIDDYLSWNGLPYITQVGLPGVESVNFVPVRFSWQLAGRANQVGKPTFVVEASTIQIRLLPRFAAIAAVYITGITRDPFGGIDRNSASLTTQPWLVSESYKALVKERTEIRLRGGSVATWQRQDKVNNGTENPVNRS